MNIVRDFQKAFDQIKNDPVKSVESLIPVLREYSESPDDTTTLRWDVMRSVVSDDFDYLKLITVAELESRYLQMKTDIEKFPPVLNVVVMTLKSDYDNYKNIADVVDIQKRVFGETVFAAIEQQMKTFIHKHYTAMLTTHVCEGMSPLSFAKRMYEGYEYDYKNYYFWSDIKASMDEVLVKLS